VNIGMLQPALAGGTPEFCFVQQLVVLKYLYYQFIGNLGTIMASENTVFCFYVKVLVLLRKLDDFFAGHVM